jgi:hypothetical protein
MEVPWQAMPTVEAHLRVTSFDLYHRLVEYGMSQRLTDMEDLNSKLRQISMVRKYPPWFCRAAKVAAYNAILADSTVPNRGWFTSFTLRLAGFTLPVTTLEWIAQSLASHQFSYPNYAPLKLTVFPSTLVSRPNDSRLAYCVQNRCEAQDVDLFYIGPQATLLEILAVANAAFATFVGLKVFFSVPIEFLWHHIPEIERVFRFFWWAIDWTPQRATLTLLCFFVAYWWQLIPSDPYLAFRTAMGLLAPSIPGVGQVLSFTIQHVFFLPSANLPFSAGLGYWWQAFLGAQFLGYATPRLVPRYLQLRYAHFYWFGGMTIPEAPFHCMGVGCTNGTNQGVPDLGPLPFPDSNFSTPVSIFLKATRVFVPDPWPDDGWHADQSWRRPWWNYFGYVFLALFCAYLCLNFLWHRMRGRLHLLPYHRSDVESLAILSESQFSPNYGSAGASLPPPRPPPPDPASPDPYLPPGLHTTVRQLREIPPTRVPVSSSRPGGALKHTAPVPSRSSTPVSQVAPTLLVPPPVHAPVAPPGQPLVAVPPPPPVPPQVGVPAAQPPVGDPFLRWSLYPSQFDTALQFRQVASGLPALPLQLVAGYDPALTCVWDMLGFHFSVDPQLLWAIWMARITPQVRPVFQQGSVPIAHLQTILTFFRVGGNVFAATEDRGILMAPQDAQPALVFPTYPDWPSFQMALTRRGNMWHIQSGAISFSDQYARVPIPNNATLALASRIVPIAEFYNLLNVPAVFSQVYQLFTGFAQNAAALASARFGLPVRQPVPLPPFAPLPATPLVPEVIKYQLTDADRQAAMMLSSDFKQKPLLLEVKSLANPIIMAGSNNAVAEMAPLREIELVLLNGVPGSGKSVALVPIIQQLAAQPGFTAQSLHIHSWFQTLRVENSQRFMQYIPGGYSANFISGLVPLHEAMSGTLILDDAGMLYPGMIQLIALLNPALERIVCTFDPCQTLPPFPESNAQSRSLPRTAEWLSTLSSQYATSSYRLSEEVRDVLGLPPPLPVPGRVATHGNIYVVSNAPEGIPLLVASPRFDETKNRGGKESLTFAGCQGSTVQDIAIDLGGMSSAMEDNMLWTALTRAKNNVFLVVPPDFSPTKLLVPHSYGPSMIVSAILAVSAHKNTALINVAADDQRIIARAVHGFLYRKLSPAARLALGIQDNPIVAGKFYAKPDDLHDLRALPQTFSAPLNTVMSARATRPKNKQGSKRAFGLMDRELFSDMPTLRASKVRHELRHHFPIARDTVMVKENPYEPPPEPINPQCLPDPALLLFDHKEHLDREVVYNGQLTEQVHPLKSQRPLQHRRGDHATEQLSFDKRLHIGHHDGVLTPKERDQCSALKRGFLKLFPVPRLSFDDGVFNEAVATCHTSWIAGKSFKDIKKSVADSSLDWDPLRTATFLKGQIVKKLPVALAQAKAGQIVSTFPKDQVMFDAVAAEYVRLVVERYRPDNVYLHNHSFGVMSRWYMQHWPIGVGNTASDYTAWDSGCNQIFAHFDAFLMRRVGLPEPMIDWYLYRKFNTVSYRGPVLPMQFSGDRFTWLFNTYRNAALTMTTYRFDPSTPCAFSGDDMILAGDHAMHKDFHPDDWPMQIKVEHGPEVDFCSWTFGADHLFISEHVLLHRAMVNYGNGVNDPSAWNSFDYSLRFARRDRPSPELATAIQISKDARRTFNLPDSLFPHSPFT